MATSIFHRATGSALAFGGLVIFTWWLAAAAISPEAYQCFLDIASSPIGWVVWVGLSWSVFQHMMSGLRHLAMDSGWGYELGIAKMSANLVWVCGAVLTILFWAIYLGLR